MGLPWYSIKLLPLSQPDIVERSFFPHYPWCFPLRPRSFFVMDTDEICSLMSRVIWHAHLECQARWVCLVLYARCLFLLSLSSAHRSRHGSACWRRYFCGKHLPGHRNSTPPRQRGWLNVTTLSLYLLSTLPSDIIACMRLSPLPVITNRVFLIASSSRKVMPT